MPVVVLDETVTADREVFGGQGWGLAQMLRLGVPVPPAAVITTDECAR